MASDTHVRTHFPSRLSQLILAYRLCRECRDGRGGHDGDDGHDSHVSTAPWNGYHRMTLARQLDCRATKLTTLDWPAQPPAITFGHALPVCTSVHDICHERPPLT